MIWGLLRQLWGAAASTPTPLRATFTGGPLTRAAFFGGVRTRATFTGGPVMRATWSG